MPIGDRQASCASQQQALDLSIWCYVFQVLNLFSFHLISSHRSFSWKLLVIASLCHRSLCHLISLISSHVFSSLFASPHLIPSNVFSPFPSQVITTVLISSHVTWAFLISSHLSLSRLFSDFHSSSQLVSAFRSSCQLTLCLLISSLLFSHHLSSSHISSADLSSYRLPSPHLSSQRSLKSCQLFSGLKPAPKTDLGAKASDPYTFHRELPSKSESGRCENEAFVQDFPSK